MPDLRSVKNLNPDGYRNSMLPTGKSMSVLLSQTSRKVSWYPYRSTSLTWYDSLSESGDCFTTNPDFCLFARCFRRTVIQWGAAGTMPVSELSSQSVQTAAA